MERIKTSKNNGSGVTSGGVIEKIPAAAKKMVESLREVVNDKSCTDAEIYAVLRDCDMDPNDAVQKLLSQDTFHEVKSKRERRKEMRDTLEPKARGSNSTISRGVKVGEYTVSRSGSTQNNYSDLSKAGYKREIGSVAPSPLYSSTSSAYNVAGSTVHEEPLPHNDPSNVDNRGQKVGTGDGISSSTQFSSEYHSAGWWSTTGHLSMADIVRMGRLHNKGSQTSSEPLYTTETAGTNSYHCIPKPPLVGSSQGTNQNILSSLPSYTSEMNHESQITTGQHTYDNEWPVIEQQAATAGSSMLDTSAPMDAKIQPSQSYFRNKADSCRNCHSDDNQLSGWDIASDSVKPQCVGYASSSNGQKIASSVEGVSHSDDNTSNNSCGHMCQHQEGTDGGSLLSFPNHSASLTDDVIAEVSSAAVGMQQLNLGKELVEPSEDNHPLVFPNNLQTLAANCPQLNFGTYKSGLSSAASAPIASSSLKVGLQENSAASVGSSTTSFNTRNMLYHGDEQLGVVYDNSKVTVEVKNYDSQLTLQPELMKQADPNAILRREFISTSSVADSNFNNIHALSSASSLVTDPKARNLPFLLNELSSYTGGIPGHMLPSAVKSLTARDSEQLSLLRAKHTMPSRYGNAAVSSMNGPTAPISEVLNYGAFSLAQQPTSQNQSAAKFTPGAVLQQLSAQTNPQHSSSLGELVNMTGYRSIPDSYMNIPGFQQSYADGHAFREPLAGMNNLPPYRGGATLNSLPLSNNANASGYGNFGSSTNIPGSLKHNLPTAPMGTAVGYDEILHSQYNNRDTFALLQQNGNSGTWDYGPGSRTMPAMSGGAYFGLPGENQQLARNRQGQHPVEQYGVPGYPRHSSFSSRDNTTMSEARPW